jgi:hypothetical protein
LIIVGESGGLSEGTVEVEIVIGNFHAVFGVSGVLNEAIGDEVLKETFDGNALLAGAFGNVVW